MTRLRCRKACSYSVLFGFLMILGILGCGGGGTGSLTNPTTTGGGTTGTTTTGGCVNGTVVDLGSNLSPAAINNNGQVVAQTFDGNNFHGALLQNGKTTDLGALLNPSSINDAGRVVGQDGSQNAATWQNGLESKLQNLPASQIPPGESQTGSSASSINTSGAIAGQVTLQKSADNTVLSAPVAVVWPTPTSAPINLDAKINGNAGNSKAIAINDSGQVLVVIGPQVGVVTQSNTSRYVLTNATGTTSKTFPVTITGDFQLGPFPAGSLNNAGEVALYADNPQGQAHLFTVAPGGAPVDRGSVLGVGKVNSIGRVAVSLPPLNPKAPNSDAGVFDPTKGMVDLNALQPKNSCWTLFGVTLNDKGETAGVASFKKSAQEGYSFQLPTTLSAPRSVEGWESGACVRK